MTVISCEKFSNVAAKHGSIAVIFNDVMKYGVAYSLAVVSAA
jgi:hypothetical protein